MRLRALAVLIGVLLLGCSAPGPVGAPANRIEGLAALDSNADLPLRIAPGWKLRDSSADSVWLVSESGELMVSRSNWAPADDYRERAEREAGRLGDWGYQVSDLEDTALFGDPAVSFTSSRPTTVSRVVVASRQWLARAQFQGQLTQREKDEVASMLSQKDESAPLVP